MAVGTGGIPAIRIAGKLGNVVFMRSGDGYVLRERITSANPRTAKQTQARCGFAVASQSWKGLSDEPFAAWTAYGQSLGRAGYNVYMSLTRKWLAVHGGGVPPTMPPTGPFFGDAVRLSISLPLGRARGGVEGLSESKTAPSLPSSRGDELVFTVGADRPNSGGVVTEILIQPLPHARRKAKAREWRTVAFHAFASGSLTLPVNVAPGAYAVAYRFVESTTGQETSLAELGAVTVVG